MKNWIKRHLPKQKNAMSTVFLDLSAADMADHFDAKFYGETNPDVVQANRDPFSHYLDNGWRELRQPFADFDIEYYRTQYMGGDMGICPLAHYVKIGLPQGAPVKYMESREFTQHQKVLNDAWIADLFRLIETVGVSTQPLKGLPLGKYLAGMFDANHYRKATNLGPEFSDNECYLRYLVFGLPNGMSPGPFFHEATYRKRAAHNKLPAIEATESPFLHWMRHGLPRDISPSPLFSPGTYVAINKDLETYPEPKISHFLIHGIDECRQFSSETLVHRSINPGTQNSVRRFLGAFGDVPAAHVELASMRAFRGSSGMRDLVEKASDIDPDVTSNTNLPRFLPPWHDAPYSEFRHVLDKLPKGDFSAVVLIPFCKVGGADYVAGILSRTLAEIDGKVLVIQTDQSDWDRPDWFGDVARLDISDVTKGLDAVQKTRLLYELLRRVRPDNVFNVNSRLAFETYVRFGKQLSFFSNLHAYYFCADRTPSGDETGYPVWYFSSVFDHLTSAITDSDDLAQSLIKRFSLPLSLAKRLRPLYTPAKVTAPSQPVVEAQIASGQTRTRPAIIWAGRFDRQKRFDILCDVAALLPDVDFLCWGKAVLDAPPDLSNLPENVTLNAPFTSYEELPLQDVDGFFYTSDWDGIPTILIELGSFGMPMVVSAAGGVGELIDETTGWPIAVGSPVEDYAAAIQNMLDTPQDRSARALALRERIQIRHSEASYAKSLKAIMKGSAR